MKKTRYLLCNRMKLQINRRQKNITDADFRYAWSYPMEHHIFEQDCDNCMDTFDSLDQVYNTLKEHAEEYQYGYRIYKLEPVEEVMTDKPYQPKDILQPA